MMRLALVADWLPTFGGAEHVIAALHELWPSSPVYTTVVNRRGIGPLQSADIRATRLQRFYQLLRRHQYLLPLMPLAVEGIDLTDVDVILSSSHAVGKGIIPSSHSVHVCYCHTPMRYAWEMEEAYLDDFRLCGWLRALVKRELKKIRRWDLSTAKRVDRFIANSRETQQRIRTIYGRESVVIHPPVNDRFFAMPLTATTYNLRPTSYYLALGRFVPYKRFDLLIELANRLRLPLTIAGSGPEEPRLRRSAGPTVTFLGFVADDALPTLYARATAVLFPQHEDAGLVPLESLASGTPVIAYARGGALDAVQDGENGLLVPKQTAASFEAAIRRFAKMPFDRPAIRESARRFSSEEFGKRMRGEVEKAWREFGKKG